MLDQFYKTSMIRTGVFKLIFSLTALLFFMLPSCLFAQKPNLKFKHITNENGLSNSTIEAIYQDQMGFIWIGTRDGLNRYDGYQIVTYKTETQNKSSISDNYIKSIFEDSKQNLWIATANGLNKFDKQKNTFKRYLDSSRNNNANNTINCIYEDKQHQVWLGTATNGLLKLDEQSDRFISDKAFNIIKNVTINQITEAQNGNLWLATNQGLLSFNPSNKGFNKIKDLASLNILVLKNMGNGSLWLGTENDGLIYYQPKSNSIKKYQYQETNPKSLGSNQVRALIIDKKDNLWVGGINSGLNLFDAASQSFYRYENEPNNLNSLSQRTVSALFEDKQGNIWIGTHRGGVNLYNPDFEKFRLYQQQNNKNSLSYNDVRSFCETSEGNLWIGTDGGGLNLFNRKTNTFKSFKNNPFDSNSLAADAILDVRLDKNNQLYIGTWGGGLNIFNPVTENFTRYINQPSNKNSISSNYIQKSFEDSNGNIWVCTYYGGLNLFNKTDGTFKRVLFGADKKTKILGNNMVSINEDREGQIWIGTDDGGLNCYNPKTKSFIHYFNNEIKKPDLRVIYMDKKGRLWIGQKGLYLFNPKAKTFKLFTNKAGLNTEFINGIAEDENGDFWVATSNGITQYNINNHQFKKYNTADGLQGLEFEANAFLKTKDNEIFFGGVNGFNAFYPAQIKINQFIPKVYLTDFQVFNKSIKPNSEDSPLETDINFTEKIKLNYDQTSISFSFAALNYIASENNSYSYQLEGFDENWSTPSHVNKASYTNLDPGTYTFKVKASNNDGVWNNEATSIKIHIATPFWETIWFRISILLIAAYVAYVILSFKRKLEIKSIEEKKQEEIHQVQLQFFTNISHEFRTPLSLIIGRIEQLIKEHKNDTFYKNYQSIYRNANRLLGLINELMDFRKVESGALKLKVIKGNINGFIDEIAQEFTQTADEKNIQFIIENKSILNEAWFDRSILEKIVLNLLQNAFKYTSNNGKVVLELNQKFETKQLQFENTVVINNDYKPQEIIFIRVADNGIGISTESINHLFERYYRITESHLGSGVGLAFVKSLTQLHKGNIWVSSEKNKGTEIIVGIPIAQNDYQSDELWVKNSEEGGVKLESIINKPEPLYISNSSIIDEEKQDVINNKTILIVDDNDELRNFLKEVLSAEYQIFEATDGKTGMEKAKEVFPDLIISDVMMPGVNGIQFCHYIKEDIETSHIPFLMLTAKSSLEAEIEGVASGADYYFTKPISTTLLQINIKNIFLQSEKLKEHYIKDQYAEVKDLAHSEKDKKFMEKIIGIIESQLINPELDIEYLSLEIGMSRTKLYQKIKSITGQSIGEFVRTIRLKKALEIMTTEDVPLTEVMYRVGIQTQSYFAKAFKKSFGKTPTQYLQELKKRA